jgi:hypothetical protein
MPSYFPDWRTRLISAWNYARKWIENHKKPTVIGIAVIVVAAAAEAKWGEEALRAVGWVFTIALPWLARRPIGLSVLALLLSLLALAVVAVWQTRPRAPEVSLSALEAELKEFRLTGYGNTQLQNPPKLSSAELQHLQPYMTELKPFVLEAADSLWRLLDGIHYQMLQKGEHDACYWWAQCIKNDCLDKQIRLYHRFGDAVDAGTDSREALAAFCWQYWRNRELLVRLASIVLRSAPQALERYSEWELRNKQLETQLERTKQIPQFHAVAQWLKAQQPNPS